MQPHFHMWLHLFFNALCMLFHTTVLVVSIIQKGQFTF